MSGTSGSQTGKLDERNAKRKKEKEEETATDIRVGFSYILALLVCLLQFFMIVITNIFSEVGGPLMSSANR
jgi:hypothetical protein